MFFFDHARREETRPASLRPENLRDIQLELERYYGLPEEERRQTDVPQIWKRRFPEDVMPALKKLSYGKCAFCERTGVPLQPYRFRPPAYASPRTRSNDKDSYLWLAFEWYNLFPICEECLPRDKSFFPIASKSRAQNPHLIGKEFDSRKIISVFAAERPYLYAPGEPFISMDGIIQQKISKNTTHWKSIVSSIKFFNLDREQLQAARRKSLIHLSEWIDPINNQDGPKGLYSLSRIDEFGLISSSDRLYHVSHIGYLSICVAHAARKLKIDEINRIPFEHPLRKSLPSDLSQEQRAILSRYLKSNADFYSRISSFVSDPSIPGAVADLPWSDILGSRFDTTAIVWNLPSSEQRRSRVTRVAVDGYKSIGHLTFPIPEPIRRNAAEADRKGAEEDIAACLLLIGENAAGKSSILEAIALATIEPEAFDDIADAGLTTSGSIHDPRLMGAPEKSPPKEASITVTFAGAGSSTVVIDRTRSRPIRSIRGAELPPLVFAYGARRFYAAGTRVRPPAHIRTLFDPTAALPDPIGWLASLAKRDSRALDEVVSALRHVISVDGHFRSIEPRPGDDVWIFVDRADGRESFVPIPLKSASSGYRAVLALICDIFRGLEGAWRGASGNKSLRIDFRELRKSECLVLIDEIEAHLHPRWKMSIVGGLRRAFPRATFVMTSHDPLCLRGTYDGEVRVLHRNHSGDGDVVESIPGIDGLQYLTVEQLLTSDLFRLLTTDPRSERAFERVADLLRRRKQQPRALDATERDLVRRLNDEIASSLPIGNTPISQLVQEALAEFLQERRSGDEGRIATARTKAKAAVKDFLREVIG